MEIYCLPKELFAEQRKLQKIKCPIGSGIFNNPVIHKCGATFCRDCIREALIAKNQCPQCNLPAEYVDFQTEEGLWNYICSLQVYCTSSVCQWKGSYKTLAFHKENDCEFSPINCKYQCGCVVFRKDYFEHIGKCPYKKSFSKPQIMKLPKADSLSNAPVLENSYFLAELFADTCCELPLRKQHFCFNGHEMEFTNFNHEPVNMDKCQICQEELKSTSTGYWKCDECNSLVCENCSDKTFTVTQEELEQVYHHQPEPEPESVSKSNCRDFYCTCCNQYQAKDCDEDSEEEQFCMYCGTGLLVEIDHNNN